MRKFKSLILSLVLLFAVFMGFKVPNKVVASAANFQLSYEDYSEKAQAILSEFCAFKDRIAGSEDEQKAAEYIKNYLTTNATKIAAKNDASTVDGVQSFKFKSIYDGIYLNSQNIIFEYKASNKTDKKVILTCNYDAPVKFDENSETYIPYGNDGLNVSASGVAVMLLLAESLPNYSLDFNIDFVFFGAGENGFSGSEFYLNGVSEDDEKNILSVINIDKVALGSNMYFYIDEINTKFSKYVSKTCSIFSKQIDLTHLNKTEYVENGLGLGYSHIALESDNVNFMKRGITTINMFAGDYETGIIMGRNEYNGKVPLTYSDNDTIEYATKTFGISEIIDNLYFASSSIETLLTEPSFEKNALSAQNQTGWFYNIFANLELVLFLSMLAFVVILVVAMYIYYKLTVKSYYANVEVEFLSSVVKISEHVDKNEGNKDVPKIVGQVLANDIKKDKTLRPEKKKKDK